MRPSLNEPVSVVWYYNAWLLLVPLGVFIAGFFMEIGYIWILAGLVTLSLGYAHVRVIRAWQVDDLSLPLALFPAALLCELFMLHYSLYRYEFNDVVWKERNICIPVMRVIPHLPKL